MNWTTPADLRAQVQKLWDKGLILACLAGGPSPFPLRLALKGPTSTELSERFQAARAWIADLQRAARVEGGHGYRLVLRETRHRVLGTNAVPDQVWVDSVEDAIALIGKRRDAERFHDLVARTADGHACLLPWLQRRALRALELAGDWPLLLDVVSWLGAHPRPGIYLRQVDIPGVHSKFIEAHRTVLSELLDLALPVEAIDRSCNGAGQFARRYGFRDKPARIRFRLLDPARPLLAPGTEQDFTVGSDLFARLAPDVTTVFITENEINFLAFPPVPDSLIIFGSGYGFDMLADAPWLQQRMMRYWGDIDTHGFAILDQVRARFPHVRSLLMDRDTLLQHRQHWTDEPDPVLRDLPRLDAEERKLYDDLRDRRLGGPVRLEQERIRFGCLEQALARLQSNGESKHD